MRQASAASGMPPATWTIDDRDSDDEPDNDSAQTASERLCAQSNDSDSENEALVIHDYELA